jgi:hypothetical protein
LRRNISQLSRRRRQVGAGADVSRRLARQITREAQGAEVLGARRADGDRTIGLDEFGQGDVAGGGEQTRGVQVDRTTLVHDRDAATHRIEGSGTRRG